MKKLDDLYEYDNGQARVQFLRGNRVWYIWSVKRQEIIAEFKTYRELVAAHEASSNSDGAYGCAEIRTGA